MTTTVELWTSSHEDVSTSILSADDPGAAVLAWSERAGVALAVVEEVSGAKDIVDAMTVMETVCRIRDVHRDAAVAASAMRVRAERRVGQLLAAQPKARGAGRAGGRITVAGSDSVPPTLAEQGISRDESSRFQRLADVDDDTFDATLADVEEQARTSGGNVTSNRVLRKVNPDREKPDTERWQDADRFIRRAGALAEAADAALEAIRWGHYPGDLPLIADGAAAKIEAARDACDSILTELRRSR